RAGRGRCGGRRLVSYRHAASNAPIMSFEEANLFKYCRMEVHAWLGAGWWALIPPGGGVVEVQPAGTVQGFFRGAGVQAGRQDGVLVAVAAGEVDGKAPPAGQPAVAEPAQRETLLGGGIAVDIGGLAAVT